MFEGLVYHFGEFETSYFYRLFRYGNNFHDTLELGLMKRTKRNYFKYVLCHFYTSGFILNFVIIMSKWDDIPVISRVILGLTMYNDYFGHSPFVNFNTTFIPIGICEWLKLQIFEFCTLWLDILLSFTIKWFFFIFVIIPIMLFTIIFSLCILLTCYYYPKLRLSRKIGCVRCRIHRLQAQIKSGNR
eukprot:UN30859